MSLPPSKLKSHHAVNVPGTLSKRGSALVAASVLASTGIGWALHGEISRRAFSSWANSPAQQLASAAGLPTPEAARLYGLTDTTPYIPGTETLGPDEMRVTACGTGMPNARPKQAAACWLVELGNGDKFLFDIGTGSAERISALKIPYNLLDKVFLSHLHSDHFGDLDALWIGGVVSNRVVPLRVWGPSGVTSEYGTTYALRKLEETFKWDVDTRIGATDTRGLVMDVSEFDYKEVNNVIYSENGVTIKTIPAIHIYDGPVSFILEWNGLSFAFSGDSYPNKWWIEHTKGVDLAVHECFVTPQDLVAKQNFTPEAALNVSTQIHTSPAQFGKVMSQSKPRMAVGYHFFNDVDTAPNVYNDVRKTYDGHLALATDYMVFNVTKDDIKVRLAKVEQDIWPQPSTIPLVPPNPADNKTPMSNFIKSGRVVYQDVLEKLYGQINKLYDKNIPVPAEE